MNTDNTTMVMVYIREEQLSADQTEAFDTVIPLGLCPVDKVEEFTASPAVQKKLESLYAWHKEIKFEKYVKSADGVYLPPYMMQ